MSLLAELKQAIYDLPMMREPGRDKIAHFCEHNGIRRSFSRARTTWQALAPSAIKPWWMILEPLKKQSRNTDNKNSSNTNNKNSDLEVLDNA
jgi:hypothetical protein